VVQNHQETHTLASVSSGILYIHSYKNKSKNKLLKHVSGQLRTQRGINDSKSNFLYKTGSYLERNGGKPETIWYMIHPRAQRSELRDADFSDSSSGETYWAVPTKLFLLCNCWPSSASARQ